MNVRVLFAGIGLLAFLAGAALWLGARPPGERPIPAIDSVATASLLAVSFSDVRGESRSLGEFQGKWLVVNFWATWCAPCREEMPGFARLQTRWGSRNVQFVGLANDDAAKVERFGRDFAINYPLWVGGETVSELSRRFGNRLGVLPHTVILDPSGNPVMSKVGPYSEEALESQLASISSNIQ